MTDEVSLSSRMKNVTSSFLIGTASSAHQIEGGNLNDWTLFEKVPGNIINGDVSGKATNHYNLFEEDFKLLSDLGFKGQRISIEWSRIFPKKGEVNYEAISHYKSVLDTLKRYNQIAFVTLHHFTTPIWFNEIGGFTKQNNLQFWDDFVTTVCQELGSEIDVFNTINEPMIYAATSYLDGIHSPGEESLRKYMIVCNNLMRAHFHAVELINKLCPNKPVGLVKNLIHFQPKSRNPINHAIYKIADIGFNNWPLWGLRNKRTPFGWKRIKRGNIGDFLGINFYIRTTTGLGLPNHGIPRGLNEKKLTQMGWGTYPEGMYLEIKKLWSKIKLPIFITENGVATDDDSFRIEYINSHLDKLVNLIEEGIDIRGYFYWSFIDNFEWEHGYDPKFGLIKFDQTTFEREVKDSGVYLGQLANEVWDDSVDLLKFNNHEE